MEFQRMQGKGDVERADSAITRRRFVGDGVAVATTLAIGAATPLLDAHPGKDRLEIPQATLGKTGAKVSVLGLGTACLGEQNQRKPDIEKLIRVFSEAVDLGITYVDTARIYGRAEAALREVLKTRRDRVFLVSKAWADTASEAEESFEKSMDALGVEELDLYHIHSCGNRNVDKLLADDGAWSALQKLKKAGKVRFTGLTGHSLPDNFVRVIEETKEVDALMIAMNFVDFHTYGFERRVLPVARKHGIGVMAMKVFGGIRGGFRNYGASKPNPSQMDREYHERSVRYVKSLEGVTGMVIGVHSADQLRENIDLVVKSRPLSGKEVASLREEGERLAPKWGPRFGPAS